MNTIQEVNLNVNSIKIITNPQYGSLHMIMFDGDLNKWFIAKEVLYVLGYNIDKVLRALINCNIQNRDLILLKYRNLKPTNVPDSNLQIQDDFRISNRGIIIINQNGLNTLIMNSNKPNAIEYRRWITSEVMVSIQETGSYIGSKEDAATRFSKLFSINKEFKDSDITMIDINGNRINDYNYFKYRILNLAFVMVFGKRLDFFLPWANRIRIDDNTVGNIIVNIGGENCLKMFDGYLNSLRLYLDAGGKIEALEEFYYNQAQYVPAPDYSYPNGKNINPNYIEDQKKREDIKDTIYRYVNL